MIVLHGSFLLSDKSRSGRFVLWAEDPANSTATRKTKSASGVPHHHPYCATSDQLREVLAEYSNGGEPVILVAKLPTVSGIPAPSRRFLLNREPKGRLTLQSWKVDAFAYDPADALSLLNALSTVEPSTSPIEFGTDAEFWKLAARFVTSLIAAQRILPRLEHTDGAYRAVWRAELEPSQRAVFEQLTSGMPPAARAMSLNPEDPEHSAARLLNEFINSTIDAFARKNVRFPKVSKQQRTSPANQWLTALTSDDPQVELPADIVEAFNRWARPENQAAAGNFRICFRLEPPMPSDDSPNKASGSGDTEWNLQYFLQAEDDPSLLVPASEVWRSRGRNLKFLNRRFDNPQERLLGGLGLASRMFEPVEKSLRTSTPTRSSLTTAQAYDFIREAALLLRSSGFAVLLPGLAANLNLRLKLSPKRTTKSASGPTPTGLGFDQLVNFDWQVALGDQLLSQAEFEHLASLKVPLVKVRGEWVEVNPDQIRQALEFWERRKEQGAIPLDQALRAALDEETSGIPVGTVEAEGWIENLVGYFNGSGNVQPVEPPEDFTGSLRPYQLQGLSWLSFLRSFSLGACLADDMGLGKTVQTLALLLHNLRNGEHRPALLICPTSVVGNWEREASRFAPSLRLLIHHGSKRSRDDLANAVDDADLVISSYSILHRDVSKLEKIDWGELILDEAQNIKNPGARQAQSARRLKAGHRIALTGTPVENRLSELWSIFQFLNPGYLGSQDSFRKEFETPIVRNGDQEKAKRLKSLVGPFLLRRLKTDPKVISDLPAKNEMKVFCNLTREQGTLYEAVVRDSLKEVEKSDGIKRKGLVLAMLMKLKQVCNHPSQFLKDGSALADRSGKLNRLMDMLEEVRSVGERALVFTQFAEMGTLLQSHIQSRFQNDVLFLHGGVPAAQRQRMVERFQEDEHGPFVFILSIKAGGTGLNLTRANQVFHFDRWWNPAVEDQATDRAFRIGQKRSVQVYKYICAGTVEERIDEMIEGKQALAKQIVGTSEAWITELSTDQLREVFALRRESIE